MDRKLLYKLVAIAFMSLLLLVPLSLIEGQVRQRSHRQFEVQQSIANGAAGPQTLVGPVLAVSYREKLEPERKRDPETGQTTTTPRFRDATLYLPPETLKLDGDTRVETRKRGIYQARLFNLSLAASGRFVIPPNLGLDAKRDILSAEASLVLGISDPRGVGNDPEVSIAGKRHRFATPKGRPAEGKGWHRGNAVWWWSGPFPDRACARVPAFRGSSRPAPAPPGSAARRRRWRCSAALRTGDGCAA
jgi:inner membrane protein